MDSGQFIVFGEYYSNPLPSFYLNYFCCCCCWSCKSSLCIFWILNPFQIYDLQKFSPILFFHFLGNILWSTEVFNFGEILFVLFWSLVLLVSYLSNRCLIQNVDLCLFSKHFMHLAPFWVSFYIWSWVRVQLYSFACDLPICPSTICWKDCSFPCEVSWLPCQKSVDRKCMRLFLDSILSVLMCHSLYIWPVFSISEVFIIWLT